MVCPPCKVRILTSCYVVRRMKQVEALYCLTRRPPNVAGQTGLVVTFLIRCPYSGLPHSANGLLSEGWDIGSSHQYQYYD